jgi:hypothetical protein
VTVHRLQGKPTLPFHHLVFCVLDMLCAVLGPCCSKIPFLQSKITAVQTDLAALTSASTISALGTSLATAATTLNSSLPATRGVLVSLNYNVDHIVDFNLVKGLLLRVKVHAMGASRTPRAVVHRVGCAAVVV